MTQNAVNAKRNILKRIKWKSVGIVLVVFILLFIMLVGFNPFVTYKGDGDVKMKAWIEPGRVGLSDKATVWVELKNQGESKRYVTLALTSYDPVVFFEGKESEITTDGNAITLGSGESRKVDFKIQINAMYSGDYGISVTAKYDREEIEDEVYISVVK